MAKIAVIGLSGQSIFMHLDDFPIPSVTTHVKSYYEEPGGKGYNQAVACNKLGCNVSYLSRIGNDYYGKYCKEYMESLDIKTFFIKDLEEKTALATILISKNGENEVIVYPGASKNLNDEDLRIFKEEIYDADVLLLQYETNIDILKKAISIAKEAKIITILNPAPAIYDDQNILESVDILTPNLEEAKKLYCLPYHINIDDIYCTFRERLNLPAIPYPRIPRCSRRIFPPRRIRITPPAISAQHWRRAPKKVPITTPAREITKVVQPMTVTAGRMSTFKNANVTPTANASMLVATAISSSCL